MNLRHTKPSYSYSESAPSIKIAELKTKHDPMLRHHAQLLLNFIQKSNQKYIAFQEMLKEKRKTSRSNKKEKYRRKRDKRSASKNFIRAQQDTSSFDHQSNNCSGKFLQQSILKHDISHQKQEQERDFPLEFIQMLLSLYEEHQSEQEETVDDLQNNIISTKIQKLCQADRSYVSLLQELYSRGFYIEGFHPSQLSFFD